VAFSSRSRRIAFVILFFLCALDFGRGSFMTDSCR
jgi:hypothetical protein